MKPNFLVVGVARCGTTSLSRYLSQHPDITFGKIKEPKYITYASGVRNFNGPQDNTVFNQVIKTEKEYIGNYAGFSARLVGDASSDTFYYHNKTVPFIRDKFGDIPIIIVLRNPVERAHSAYNNLIRDSREHLSFVEGIRVEKERIEKRYDWMWYYTNGSKYAEGLEAFKEHFSNVKVILNDDLKGEIDNTLKGLLSFLGVQDESFDFDTSIKYSTSGKSKFGFFNRLISRKSLFYPLRQLIIRFVPRFVLEKLAAKMLVKSELSSNMYSELQKSFYQDIKKTERMIGRDLSGWLNKPNVENDL